MAFEMLDAVSLDQIRAFIASAEEGSFSAAARKLRRAQSRVSELVAGLEFQMAVLLFDRSTRSPRLTPAGIALLADARSVIVGIDVMKARAKGMSLGIEPELSVVVDVLYPIAAITDAANAFRDRFPGTPLRLFVEALGATHQRVLDGTASVGIAAALPNGPTSLGSERLAGVTIVMVAAPHHPLASFEGTIPRTELAKHVQLVLTDRSTLSDGVEFAVVSPSIWRLPNFIVHTLQEVNDGLAHGRYFFMDIAADGIALYQADDTELHTPKPKTPKQALKMAQEYFDEWFPSAMRRYEVVRYDLSKGFLKEAAFDLHQTTERLYHCVLLVMTFYTPHVHNLGFLRSQAEKLDRGLLTVWPRDTHRERARFEKLKDAYVKARYSKHYRITAEELTWLGDQVEELGRVVHAVCRDRLAALEVATKQAG